MAAPRQALARSVKEDCVSGQAQSANGKENKRSANGLVGDDDGTREGLVSKRARMGTEVAAQMQREEKREGKKRARDDDDEVSPASSGDATLRVDNQHQAKRAKRSLEGSSTSLSSASPHR
ncbi:hypothetical protein BD410DRAFT_788297, partial [Rickenella mellea]